ncbi:hypothetical protein PJL18_02476 [Paenarthrobacter nicotinovorans]|nr:hypothetical protein [Paenarthrobacter nicotinovorans]
MPEASADLVNCMAGAGVNGVSVVPGGGVTGGPDGGVPVVVALLATWPASISACVTAYVAVAVTVWPGSSSPGVPGQLYARADKPGSGSEMETFFNVTLPVFFAEKEYVITSPTLVGF